MLKPRILVIKCEYSILILKYEKDYFDDFISNHLSRNYLKQKHRHITETIKKTTSFPWRHIGIDIQGWPTVKCRCHLKPLKSFDDTFCIYISCFTGNRIVRNACKADIGSRHPAALRRRRCADKDYSAPSYTDDILHRKRPALSPLGPLKCKQ